MRKHYAKIIFGIILMTLLAGKVGAEPPSHDHLSSQAENFLTLLDQDRYDDAWESMSVLFQNLNNQIQWQSRQKTIRAAYGALSSRQLHHIKDRQSYAQSPDGRYVVVQFKSGYTYKADSIETVVLDCQITPDCSIREYIIQ